MAKTNVARKVVVHTYEGGRAFAHLSPLQQLRRSVASCLLWEDEFYEDGATIADRIVGLVGQCDPGDVAALAVEARGVMNLRHVPLLLVSALADCARGAVVGRAVRDVIQRADELAEVLAVRAKLVGKPVKKALTAQIRKGVAMAFPKFGAYALAKYNRDGAVKLRDALFLSHAKPKDDEQAAVWKQLVDGTLAAPDTWEVALSAGADKKGTWERLLREGQLGYLALLRNLRNMMTVGVDVGLVRDALLARKGATRVLPFRYVAAARACPQLEPVIDQALVAAIAEMPVLMGKTVVLVDVSQSMTAKLSARSDLTRMDAAAALASMIGGDVRVFSFSAGLVEVPARRGMAGVDAVLHSQPYSGTALFDAVAVINEKVQYDRLIVITDEQATGPGVRFGHYIMGNVTTMPAPKGIGYCINVASAKNGVGYGPWVHIDGFSESVLRFISENERLPM